MRKEAESNDRRRALPSVDRLLAEPTLEKLFGLYGRDLVRAQVRDELESIRSAPPDGLGDAALAPAAVAERVVAALDRRLGGRLRRVINATGILIHTNLGRAPLPRGIAESVSAALTAACDLEMDLETGRRSSRGRRAEALLTAITGAEAAAVVNNNAAALVLALAAVAAGREVIVSRGELVEIGGSFRIPDLIAASGARLVEVGTTNRTRLDDYERAIGPDTGLVLKVHPSNYKIRGFVESVAVRDLAELSARRSLPLLVDEGSGLLRPVDRPQLSDHESLAESVAAGASLACGSGDKLACGPQAGLLVGGRTWIGRCRSHPIYRAVRPGRFTLAALEAVLRLHLAGGDLPLSFLWPDPESHRRRLERVAEAIGAEIVPADAFVGGGSAADEPIPGEALALADDGALLARLRTAAVAVVGYLRDGRLVLDLRSVDPSDDSSLVEAVREARGL